MDASSQRHQIVGSVRHQGEMEDFRSYLGLIQYQAAIMITPSEIEYELWFSDNYWAQSWKCDSAKYGD